MIPELGGQQFGQRAVVLMRIVALRPEHHIRIAGLPKGIELGLDPAPMRGRAAVGEIQHRERDLGPGTEGR